MRTNIPKHSYKPRPKDTWCRICNCTKGEHASLEFLNADTLHDFVVAHSVGAPTVEGVTLALQLWARGDDYATIAHEVVFRGLHA